MISEKTVELNLTTEWLNLMYRRTRRVYFAIGMSPRAESKLPIDAWVRGAGGGGVMIQYKRAYVNGKTWSWRLNRTTYRDQHHKLQQMERCGFPVFYALPFFHTNQDLARYRRRLLGKHTFFFKPSMIRPKGGVIGHHEIWYWPSAKKWSVTSDEESAIGQPLPLDDVVSEFENGIEAGNLSAMLDVFRKEFGGTNPNRKRRDSRLADGLSVIAGVPSMKNRVERALSA